jgi:hypothetical protein
MPDIRLEVSKHTGHEHDPTYFYRCIDRREFCTTTLFKSVLEYVGSITIKKALIRQSIYEGLSQDEMQALDHAKALRLSQLEK